MPSFAAVEETWGGLKRERYTPTKVDVPTNTLTGEELVRSYVYQVHADAEYAARSDRLAREAALTDEEKRLNANLAKRRGPQGGQTSPLAGWKQSAEVALAAFSQGRLLVFVDDQQVLPETSPVDVTASATVRFVQILPLVGG
jgi:hypothetical protein